LWLSSTLGITISDLKLPGSVSKEGIEGGQKPLMNKPFKMVLLYGTGIALPSSAEISHGQNPAVTTSIS
jgi:hypothetical protein